MTRSSRLDSGSTADEAVAWTVAGCPGLLLLRARYERQYFSRHTHDTYVIGVNERGAHATWHRGAQHVIPEHTVAVIAAGEVHTGVPVRDHQWHYRALYLPPPILAEMVAVERGGRDNPPHFPQLMINDAGLADRFLRIHRQSEQARCAFAAQSAIVDFLTSLLRHADWAPAASVVPDSRAVQLVIEYLRDHIADPVSLDNLATVAGLSRYQVIRTFRRARGLTPYAYLIQIRVERAKRLLEQGTPLAAAAQAAGFADQSHLTRAFRRLTGLTPGRYAASARS